jgi:hypothetical protein
MPISTVERTGTDPVPKSLQGLSLVEPAVDLDLLAWRT